MRAPSSSAVSVGVGPRLRTPPEWPVSSGSIGRRCPSRRSGGSRGRVRPPRTVNEAWYVPSARRVAVTVTAVRPGCLNETVGFEASGSIVVNATRSVWPALTRVADGVAANALAQTGRTSDRRAERRGDRQPRLVPALGGEAAVRQPAVPRPGPYARVLGLARPDRAHEGTRRVVQAEGRLRVAREPPGERRRRSQRVPVLWVEGPRPAEEAGGAIDDERPRRDPPVAGGVGELHPERVAAVPDALAGRVAPVPGHGPARCRSDRPGAHQRAAVEHLDRAGPPLVGRPGQARRVPVPVTVWRERGGCRGGRDHRGRRVHRER